MRYTFVPGLFTVVLRPEGAFRAEEAARWNPELREHPDYQPGMHQVYDLTAVDFQGVSPRTLRDAFERISSVEPKYLEACIALVADADLAFALARTYTGIAGSRIDRRWYVARSVEEALAWIRSEVGEGG